MKLRFFKINLFTIILLFSPVIVVAQMITYPSDKPWRPDPKARYGKDKMEFVYKHTVTDTDPAETKEFMEILQVGDKFAVYQDFYIFRLDSVRIFADTLNAKQQEMSDLYFIYCGGKETINHHLIFNENNILEFFHNGFNNNYYEEPFPEMDWQLTEETKEINGHPCLKATLNFRGREWTAWYATDIPLPYGPWKFQGLPGLIMEVSDVTGAHSFNLASFNANTDNYIVVNNQETRKNSRQDYLKTQHYLYKEGGENEILSSMIVGGDYKPKKPRMWFYVPLELE